MADAVPPQPRTSDTRRRALTWGAVAAVCATIAAGATLAPGFDQREVTPDNPSVWAMQSVAGQRFGRVNTVVGEVDTVKTAVSPSDLVQSGSALLVYSNNLSSVTTVDTTRPADIDPNGSQATVATPSGTEAVSHAGPFVAYLTDSGQVLAGSIPDGTAVAPVAVDPFAGMTIAEGQERPQFRALAVAVSPSGEVVAYSAEQGHVMRASARTGEVTGMDALTGGPNVEGLQMTIVGDRWVLYDPSTGQIWRQGEAEPTASGADASGRLQQSTDSGAAVLIADAFGVVTVDLASGEATRQFGIPGTNLGEPAAPALVPGSDAMVAAWLPAGAGPGTLWKSDGTTASLDYGALTLGDQRSPQLRSNGSRLILNESRTGWVWNADTGDLVPSSQLWDSNDETPTTDDEQEVATQVTDPRAPVAEDDTFGVRAGHQVQLPILLNDHDANKDVLTVWRSLLGTLDPAFGTLAVADDDQSLVVNVAPNATGTTIFTYVISDGTSSDGLLSEPAMVTLTVKDPSINTAPEWCGVEGCLAQWPQPQVNPGGTVMADVITGWVDPEGDPVYLADATTDFTPGAVAASPDGRLVFQHTNPAAGGGARATVAVTVSDSRGATASKDLVVTVLDEPTLRANDLSLTVTAGVQTTVNVGDAVTGAVGPLQLTEASLAPGDSATVSPAQGLTGFTFLGNEPGSHLVDYKVSDGAKEARGVVRITVEAPEDERLTTVPLTAFVRSKEDVTVDVLRAVSNPGGRVLLISGVRVDPQPNAQLTSDVIGFSALRMSGDTADGQPGTLGTVTYTVSDGSGRPGMTATGEVTVILLGVQTPAPPLAVDDAITMRVGSQRDIAVLANDIGPAGNILALDPESVINERDVGLVFAAGSSLRVLAPSTPGVYTVRYSAYVLGYPAQRSSARLIITVLDDPTNSPPTPRDLTGRVTSGQSVRLAFDGTGIDPDGDRVFLDRVETQPSSGIAAVAADGQAINYTAAPGFAGQVTFTYSVIDGRGQKATGTATVGVIAKELEARPVTYTDYVQAQAGTGRTVVVVPTANDFDLAGGELSLVDVSPDAPIETEEYRSLAERVVSVVGDTVTLDVGEEAGTFVYLYTVRNATGSTAVSRIILKAVREPVADVPIVTDTVLTLDARDSLPTGVDVLTDKVTWSSGDPAQLTLTLWGDQPGMTVKGRTIAGPLTAERRIVTFQVTGLNFAGEEVTSYGFLRIPGLDESRVSLKDVFTWPQVEEGSSVTFDLQPLVAIPANTELVIDPADVEASGVRKGSTCELVSGTMLKYTASDGEPWTDMCRVSARIKDQDRYTLVPVPIIVVPRAPSPILTSASLVVSPGATTTFDLANMVSWPAGATPRAVDIAITYNGQQFVVSRVGTVLTITGQDRSVPGKVDGATVSLPSDPDVPAVSLSFTVGPAPSTLPKAATVARQCSQAAGSSCNATVIGAPGEVNPLPETPLEIRSVAQDPNCPGVTFAIDSPTTLSAAWLSDTPGSTCTAVYTVADAQGRVSAGNRVGTLTIDLQGFPAAPSEAHQTAFGDGTLALGVSEGAGVSYPAITGYVVREGAVKVATCGLDGLCTPIVGLRNGQHHTYTVKTVNAVGESRGSVSVIAWAYAPPAAPQNVTWTPSTGTAGEGKRIDIELDITDPDTRELTIVSATGETKVVAVGGRSHLSIPGYLLGSNDSTLVTITPTTALDLPQLPGAAAQGAAVTFAANGIGAPTIGTITSEVAPSGTSAVLTVPVTSGGVGSDIWVGYRTDGPCLSQVLAASGTAVLTVPVTPNVVNHITVCAQSRVGDVAYGWAATVDHAISPWADPGVPTVTTGYRVGPSCVGDGMSCVTGVTAPVINLSAQPSTVKVRYSFDGGPRITDFTMMPIGAPTVARAFLCVQFPGASLQCSPTGAVLSPDAGYAPYRASVTVAPCAVGDAPSLTVAGDTADWNATWSLFDADGTVTTDVTAMRTAQVTVDFTNALAGIASWTSEVTTCSGAPAPDPTPDPTPDPSPSP